jgi:hypothetical protein
MNPHKRPPFLLRTIDVMLHNPTWGLIIAIVISLAVNIMSIQYIYSLQGSLQSMFKTDLIGQNYVQTARIKLLTIDKELNNLFLLQDPDDRDVAINQILANRHELEALIGKSKPFFRAKKSTVVVQNAGLALAQCSATMDTLISLSKNADASGALDIISGPMKDRFGKLDEMLKTLDAIKQRHDLRMFKNIDYSLTISIVATVVSLVITIGFRLFLFRKRRTKIQKENSLPDNVLM